MAVFSPSASLPPSPLLPFENKKEKRIILLIRIGFIIFNLKLIIISLYEILFVNFFSKLLFSKLELGNTCSVSSFLFQVFFLVWSRGCKVADRSLNLSCSNSGCLAILWARFRVQAWSGLIFQVWAQFRIINKVLLSLCSSSWGGGYRVGVMWERWLPRARRRGWELKT